MAKNGDKVRNLKNILFITDLSEEARQAALDLAAAGSADCLRLILLYSFLPEPAEDGQPEPVYVTELQVQQKLDALASMLYQTYGISVTRLVKPNLQTADIQEMARQLKADEVVKFTAAIRAESTVSQNLDA